MDREPAGDTTQEATPERVPAQRRETTDPTERDRPIPLLAVVLSLGMLAFGVGYIVWAEPPGAAEFGDRRTIADLRGADSKPAGAVDGQQVYTANCVACHQANGKGLAGVFPPLDASEWVIGDERVVANILLHGINGQITVAGASYQGAMPPFKQLSDAELSAVTSHVRAAWSNKAPPIDAAVFTAVRKATPRTTPYAGGAELATLRGKPP
jgi:mono/diheme cytochrome c family protein